MPCHLQRNFDAYSNDRLRRNQSTRRVEWPPLAALNPRANAIRSANDKEGLAAASAPATDWIQWDGGLRLKESRGRGNSRIGGRKRGISLRKACEPSKAAQSRFGRRMSTRLSSTRHRPAKSANTQHLVFTTPFNTNTVSDIKHCWLGEEERQCRTEVLQQALSKFAGREGLVSSPSSTAALSKYGIHRIVSFISQELMAEDCYHSAIDVWAAHSKQHLGSNQLSLSVDYPQAHMPNPPDLISNMWLAFVRRLRTEAKVREAPMAVYEMHLANEAIHEQWCTLLDGLDRRLPELMDFFVAKGYRTGRGRNYTTVVLSYFQDCMGTERRKVKESIWHGAMIRGLTHTFGRHILWFLPSTIYRRPARRALGLCGS